MTEPVARIARRSRLNVEWLIWEVAVPLGLPVIASLVIVILNATGPSPKPISIARAIDLAPWTLCFFSFTLLASSMRRFWFKFSESTIIAVSLLVCMALVAVYTGMLVSWHQDASFKPSTMNYVVSGIFTLATIWSCHASSKA